MQTKQPSVSYLRSVREGEEIAMPGLSWRGNMVVGDYLGVWAQAEKIFEVLDVLQEEESWRGLLAKVEMRVCSGNPVGYVCVWRQGGDDSGGDYLRLRLGDKGMRLWTGDGKHFVPYRDEQGRYGYDWRGGQEEGMVCCTTRAEPIAISSARCFTVGNTKIWKKSIGPSVCGVAGRRKGQEQTCTPV